MLKSIRDHLYRIRHYTWKDSVNKGYRLTLLFNYLRWLLFYKHLNRKYKITLQNGYCSWVYPYPDHDAGEANIFTRNVDYHENEFVRKYLNKGDFVIDAGCNVGNRTLVLADIISGALMIDANASAISRVKENLEMNGVNLADYFLVTKAVGDREGEITFSDKGGASTQNTVVEAGDHLQHGKTITIEMTTIDVELRNIQREPAFIKIDVEGYDLHALKGATATLQRGNVKLVKFENGDFKNLEEILSFFKELKWQVFALDDTGMPTLDESRVRSSFNLFAAPLGAMNEILTVSP